MFQKKSSRAKQMADTELVLQYHHKSQVECALIDGACVQAFIVHTTQPVGCVRALGEAKVAQHGSLQEGNRAARSSHIRLPAA